MREEGAIGPEANRSYNMVESRDYICVQSLPSLPEGDHLAAIDPRGWRIAYCKDEAHRDMPNAAYSDNFIFNLDELRQADNDGSSGAQQKSLLCNTTFYKEILVEKTEKYENPAWIMAKKAARAQRRPRIPAPAGLDKIPLSHTNHKRP